jgi:hypothetical protein
MGAAFRAQDQGDVMMAATDESVLTVDEARRITAPLYDALNRPAEKDVSALLARECHDDYRSYHTNQEFLTRDQLADVFRTMGTPPPVRTNAAVSVRRCKPNRGHTCGMSHLILPLRADAVDSKGVGRFGRNPSCDVPNNRVWRSLRRRVHRAWRLLRRYCFGRRMRERAGSRAGLSHLVQPSRLRPDARDARRQAGAEAIDRPAKRCPGAAPSR